MKKKIFFLILSLVCFFLPCNSINLQANYDLLVNVTDMTYIAQLDGSWNSKQRYFPMNETFINIIMPLSLNDVNVYNSYGADIYIYYSDVGIIDGANYNYYMAISYDKDNGATNSVWGEIYFYNYLTTTKTTILNGGLIPVNTLVYFNITQGSDWLNIQVKRQNDDYLFGSQNISITNFNYDYLTISAKSDSGSAYVRNDLIDNEYLDVYAERPTNLGQIDFYSLYSLSEKKTINVSIQDYYNINIFNITINTTEVTNLTARVFKVGETTNRLFLDSYNKIIHTIQIKNTTYNTYEDGEYYVNITINNEESYLYNFTIDTKKPNISINNNMIESYFVNWSYVFNYSDKNLDYCYIITENNTTNCSSYIFASNGNQNISIYVYDKAGNINNINTTILINPFFYFYFVSPSGNEINNFTLNNINFDNYSKFNVYDYGLGEETFTFEKYGYARTNFTINITNISKINNTYEIKIALLYLNIKNKDTSEYIEQNTNLKLIGDSFAGEFETINGKLTISNITELPGIYQLIINSENYEELTYYFQHTGFSAVNLTLLLQNNTNTVPIKYVIRDGFGNVLDNALVKLSEYQIASNSYILTEMEYTNTLGEVIFNIDTSNYIKPQVVYNGVTTSFDGTKITSTPIYLTIDDSELDLFPKIPELSSKIIYTQLNNNTGRFTFTFSDVNNIISKACLNITQSSYLQDNIIAYQCVESASGSINVEFNITAGNTYKANGYVIYNEEEYLIQTYYKRITEYEFSWGVWGILFSLVLIGGLAFVGFFIGKAKGVLFGATVGLWVVSLNNFYIWSFNSAALILWSVLLLLGAIFG